MEIEKINSLKDAIMYHNQIVNFTDEEIVLDFSSTSFVRNNFIAILGLALERHKNKRIKIIEPKNIKIKKSLASIGFLSKYSDCREGVDLNSTMIQYTNIQNENSEYYDFYKYFVNQLNRKVNNLSPELSNKIMQKIFERFSNVFRHSKSNLGFFCSGQFYPKKREFYFTIADGGVTIKKNVNEYLKKITKKQKSILNFKRFNELNGIESIRWALIDNNSTTGSGGFGLSLLKELILKSKGRLEIVSCSGYYKIENGEEREEELLDEFSGTIISVGLSTDNNKYYYLKKGDKDDD